jgi:UTP--glucose-1-phosphate uridylyltransferase
MILIKWKLQWALEMERIEKCVIPAAVLEKRFYPLTRAKPKKMLLMLGKPVFHYVVEEAVNSGLDEILLVVGAGKDSIINYFNKHALDKTMDAYGFRDLQGMYFVRQKEQRGFADAIKYAQKFTRDENFVVLLEDTLYRSSDNRTVTSQIVEEYSKVRSPVLAVEKVPKEKVVESGLVDPAAQHNSLFKIRGVVEKPEISQTPSDFGITGIYVFRPEIYNYVSAVSPGRNNELQLSDAINIMANERDVFGYIINGRRYDIGTKEVWYRTSIEFSKNDMAE